MRRSTGVTVSAIFVFLGSGLTVLLGSLMGFASWIQPQQPAQPVFIRYVLAVSVVLYFVFAIWGIISGVGLLLLRNWARVSMLVFSGIVLCFTLPGLLIVPFLPMPEGSDSSGGVGLAIKLFAALFYALFAAVGGVWAYFFSRSSVKEQFLGLEEMTRRAANPPRRPLSITIIAWVLLVTACFCAPFALFLHYPMMCLGFVLTGWSANLFMLMWCLVQGSAGAGLLRLRSWARTLAIGVLSFGLLNSAAMVLLPGAFGRLLQMNAETQARLRVSMGLPASDPLELYAPERMHSLLWFGLVFGVLLFGMQLWFVVSRRAAFSNAPDVPVLGQ